MSGSVLWGTDFALLALLTEHLEKKRHWMVVASALALEVENCQFACFSCNVGEGCWTRRQLAVIS